jgi:hypothetical protein
MKGRSIVAGAAAALAASGCVERVERLVVEPDGTVAITASFDALGWSELFEGDAVPTLAAGWVVADWVELDREAREHHHLRAEAVFPADVPLPSSFAEPQDPRAEEYLQFPTTLQVERRSEGTYYHFRRVYAAREWARIEALRRVLLEERLKALSGKDLEDLSREDHALVIQSLADFEVAKMLTFARRAFLEVSPDAAQDGWLAVHAAIDQLRGEIDFPRLLALLAIEDRTERERLLQEEAKRWEADAYRRLQEAVREFCGFSGRQMSAFVHHYEKQKRTLEITSELGDDAFEIAVAMPGLIVGSNADSVAGNEASWRFGGERFRDRDLELMVSSMVPAR